MIIKITILLILIRGIVFAQVDPIPMTDLLDNTRIIKEYYPKGTFDCAVGFTNCDSASGEDLSNPATGYLGESRLCQLSDNLSELTSPVNCHFSNKVEPLRFEISQIQRNYPSVTYDSTIGYALRVSGKTHLIGDLNLSPTTLATNIDFTTVLNGGFSDVQRFCDCKEVELRESGNTSISVDDTSIEVYSSIVKKTHEKMLAKKIELSANSALLNLLQFQQSMQKLGFLSEVGEGEKARHCLPENSSSFLDSIFKEDPKCQMNQVLTTAIRSIIYPTKERSQLLQETTDFAESQYGIEIESILEPLIPSQEYMNSLSTGEIDYPAAQREREEAKKIEFINIDLDQVATENKDLAKNEVEKNQKDIFYLFGRFLVDSLRSEEFSECKELHEENRQANKIATCMNSKISQNEEMKSLLSRSFCDTAIFQDSFANCEFNSETNEVELVDIKNDVLTKYVKAIKDGPPIDEIESTDIIDISNSPKLHSLKGQLSKHMESFCEGIKQDFVNLCIESNSNIITRSELSAMTPLIGDTLAASGIDSNIMLCGLSSESPRLVRSSDGRLISGSSSLFETISGLRVGNYEANDYYDIDYALMQAALDPDSNYTLGLNNPGRQLLGNENRSYYDPIVDLGLEQSQTMAIDFVIGELELGNAVLALDPREINNVPSVTGPDGVSSFHGTTRSKNDNKFDPSTLTRESLEAALSDPNLGDVISIIQTDVLDNPVTVSRANEIQNTFARALEDPLNDSLEVPEEFILSSAYERPQLSFGSFEQTLFSQAQAIDEKAIKPPSSFEAKSNEASQAAYSESTFENFGDFSSNELTSTETTTPTGNSGESSTDAVASAPLNGDGVISDTSPEQSSIAQSSSANNYSTIPEETTYSNNSQSPYVSPSTSYNPSQTVQIPSISTSTSQFESGRTPASSTTVDPSTLQDQSRLQGENELLRRELELKEQELDLAKRETAIVQAEQDLVDSSVTSIPEDTGSGLSFSSPSSQSTSEEDRTSTRSRTISNPTPQVATELEPQVASPQVSEARQNSSSVSTSSGDNFFGASAYRKSLKSRKKRKKDGESTELSDSVSVGKNFIYLSGSGDIPEQRISRLTATTDNYIEEIKDYPLAHMYENQGKQFIEVFDEEENLVQVLAIVPSESGGYSLRFADEVGTSVAEAEFVGDNGDSASRQEFLSDKREAARVERADRTRTFTVYQLGAAIYDTIEAGTDIAMDDYLDALEVQAQESEQSATSLEAETPSNNRSPASSN